MRTQTPRPVLRENRTLPLSRELDELASILAAAADVLGGFVAADQALERLDRRIDQMADEVARWRHRGTLFVGNRINGVGAGAIDVDHGPIS